MNYSKSMKLTQRTKRIILSWIIVLIVGILIGWGITNIGYAATNDEETTETMAQFKEIEPFGTIEGKSFNWEIPNDWVSGAALEFVPLDVDMNDELQKFIYTLSYGYNIDFAFVMGVIKTESDFNSRVISSTNDYGLMQINEINHDWLKKKLGITDFLDPYQNTKSGIYILRNLFEKYDDPVKVLMAYNLGETGASNLWNQGIYETNYSNKVLENIQVFSNYINERKVENE